MYRYDMKAWILLAFIQLREKQKRDNESYPVGEGQSEFPKKRKPSKVLANFGKYLAGLGTGLEERYAIQPKSAALLKEQSNPGGC